MLYLNVSSLFSPQHIIATMLVLGVVLWLTGVMNAIGGNLKRSAAITGIAANGLFLAAYIGGVRTGNTGNLFSIDSAFNNGLALAGMAVGTLLAIAFLLCSLYETREDRILSAQRNHAQRLFAAKLANLSTPAAGPVMPAPTVVVANARYSSRLAALFDTQRPGRDTALQHNQGDTPTVVLNLGEFRVGPVRP